LLLVLLIAEMLMSHAFLNIALTFLLIYLAVNVARSLTERTDFSVWWAMFIVGALSMISFMLTRSREPIAIVFLFLVFLHAKKHKEQPWKLVTLLLAGFCAVVLYGALRDGGGIADVLGMVGIEALGEGGTVHLIGSHVVGLSTRDLLPAELDESILQKAARVVPFVAKEEMLADRYITIFYPNIASQGGGFAY